MSEETTQNLPDGDLGRILARFDSTDARFDSIDTRLDSMDKRLEKLEARAYDTKPILERALAEILAVSQKLDTVERKLNVLSQDMLSLRADQTRLEDRLDNIESKPVQ